MSSLHDLKRLCEHEASHGVVAIDQAFNGFTRVLIDLVTPGTTRRGGLDIYAEDLVDRFSVTRPVEQRQAFARQLIAIYAAGRQGELLIYNNAREEWSRCDNEDIETFGIWGVREALDVELLEQNSGRDNDWSKWEQVDALIENATAFARKILVTRTRALRRVSDMLLGLVRSKGSDSFLTRDQLVRAMRSP